MFLVNPLSVENPGNCLKFEGFPDTDQCKKKGPALEGRPLFSNRSPEAYSADGISLISGSVMTVSSGTASCGGANFSR